MTFIKRKPNWLPIPKYIKTLGVSSVAVVDFKEKFPIGEVVRFLPYLGIGRIKAKEDQFIPFSLNEISVLPKDAEHKLSAGSRVGFDVSNTSKGKRVIKLKVL